MDHKTASKLAKDMIRRWHTSGDDINIMYEDLCKSLGRRVNSHAFITALQAGDAKFPGDKDQYDFLLGYTKMMQFLGAEGFQKDE